jgi:hypothetical protein
LARRLLDRPTKRMRDKAIRALSAVVDDPGSPTHARVTAARAIFGPPKNDEPEDSKPSGPRTTIWLPANGRGPEVLGPTGDPNQTTFLYDESTAEGRANLMRWVREVREAAGDDEVTMLGPQYAAGSFDDVWSRIEAAALQLPAPSTAS